MLTNAKVEDPILTFTKVINCFLFRNLHTELTTWLKSLLFILRILPCV